jgi:hypothetical protein
MDRTKRDKASEQFDELKKLLKSYHDEDSANGPIEGDDYIKDPDLLAEMAMFIEKEDIHVTRKCNLFNNASV